MSVRGLVLVHLVVVHFRLICRLLQCPVAITTYAEQFRAKSEAATAAVASVTAVGVSAVVAALAFLYYRSSNTPGVSAAEATLRFASRLSALRLGVGVFAAVSSFAFLSSILSIASAGVALAMLRDLPTAKQTSSAVVRGACSHPLHAANLAVAAAVFCLFDLVLFGALDFTVVPDLWPTLIEGNTNLYSYYYTASFARSQ